MVSEILEPLAMELDSGEISSTEEALCEFELLNRKIGEGINIYNFNRLDTLKETTDRGIEDAFKDDQTEDDVYYTDEPPDDDDYYTTVSDEEAEHSDVSITNLLTELAEEGVGKMRIDELSRVEGEEKACWRLKLKMIVNMS